VSLDTTRQEAANLEQEEVEVNPFAEVGATGLKRFHGTVDEEYLLALQGDRGRRVYQQMSEGDATIGALIFAIDRTVRSVTWTTEGEDGDARTQFIEECRTDTSHTWDEFISQAMTMVTFGWSWSEIVYKLRRGQDVPEGEATSKYRDGRIGWRKFAPRSQDSLYEWAFDENGGIQGMIQEPPPDYRKVFLPIEKCLHFVTSSHNENPEGRSLLRTAYRAWYFKSRIENIEAIGTERDLAGLPVFYVPPGLLSSNASADEKAQLNSYRRILRNLRRDEQEGLILPASFDADGNRITELVLLSTGGRREFDTGAIVNRYSVDILSTVLADFILLGHQAVGSFALGKTKADMFVRALNSLLEAVEAVLNEHAVPRLLTLNGMPTENAPRITFSRLENVDLAELIQYAIGLGSLDFDHNTMNDLRRKAGLPELTEKEAEREAERKAEKVKAAQEAFRASREAPQGDPQDDQDE
jgi:hypothetical protein